MKCAWPRSGGFGVIITGRREAATTKLQWQSRWNFAWFNVLKPMRDGAWAHEMRMAAKRRVWGYYNRTPRSGYNKIAVAKPLEFCMVQCSQTHARRRMGA